MGSKVYVFAVYENDNLVFAFLFVVDVVTGIIKNLEFYWVYCDICPIVLDCSAVH